MDANTSETYQFSPTGDLKLDIQLERPMTDIRLCGATGVASTETARGAVFEWRYSFRCVGC